jgi:hypothetical protein
MSPEVDSEQNWVGKRSKTAETVPGAVFSAAASTGTMQQTPKCKNRSESDFQTGVTVKRGWKQMSAVIASPVSLRLIRLEQP